jgi:hypothetical protein
MRRAIYQVRRLGRLCYLVGTAAGAVVMLANTSDRHTPATDTAYDQLADRPLLIQLVTSVDGQDFVRMQRERHEHGRLSVYACGWHWHVKHVQYPHLRAATSPRIGRVA